MRVEIQHIVDERTKEIYHFEKHGSVWKYVGIYFSRRNDENDIWGDEWTKRFHDQKMEELNFWAQSKGYEDYYSIGWTDLDAWTDKWEIDEIRNKYNPVCQSTKHGEPYYSGQYGGELPKPKISVDQIKIEILKQVSKIKVEL